MHELPILESHRDLMVHTPHMFLLVGLGLGRAFVDRPAARGDGNLVCNKTGCCAVVQFLNVRRGGRMRQLLLLTEYV